MEIEDILYQMTQITDKTHRQCKTCGELKEISKFLRDIRCSNGYKRECITCATTRRRIRYNTDTQVKTKKLTQQRNWCKNNRHKLKGYNLKASFNISPENYTKMLLAQDNCCKICGTHKNKLKRSFAVDHCHTTNKIRGLLCSNCNIGLGQFKDDIILLKNAITYLEESQNDS